MTERTTRKPKAKEDAPRSGRARAVADLLPDVGGAAFRRFGFIQSAVVTRWAEIVGERYAGVSTPESIKFPHGKRSDGVLNLLVQGAHAPMLQHVAPTILERVNRFFGYTAVARLAIRQGVSAKPEPRRAPPSIRPVPAELGESLRTIGDPELRACLASLAGAVASTSGPPIVPVLPDKKDRLIR